MDSTREIKIGSETYLLVSVPKDAKGIHLFTMAGKQDLEYNKNMRCWVDLPKAKWQLIGRASELTEDDWRGIFFPIQDPFKPLHKQGEAWLAKYDCDPLTTVILKLVKIE